MAPQQKVKEGVIFWKWLNWMIARSVIEGALRKERERVVDDLPDSGTEGYCTRYLGEEWVRFRGMFRILVRNPVDKCNGP